MKQKLLGSAFVLLVSVGLGMAAGLWWASDTEAAICDRLELECGDAAMRRDDCLVGRQQDLLRHGLRAMSRVKVCLAKAPHDCLAVSACVAAVDD
ncbi:MAG: hypothetical protein JNK82_10335 [Myxococcaceae bacterium]|nr:hypothetical protein [Myxococcaceae bacterium]